MKRREIERLLPSVFQRTVRPASPIFALLELMEDLHEPSEEVLARLETFFNPRRAPDAFVPYLAGWVDLDRLLMEAPGEFSPESPHSLASGLGPLRELVAAAAHLSKWRGTANGLLHFLEIATGIEGFEVDELVPGPDGRPIPFHVRVRGPHEAAHYRPMIERIIASEKPAYVTHELTFRPGS